MINLSLNFNLKKEDFAIAVSGGVDSMALAFLVKKQFPHIKFTAIIVDHKFRPESRKEAKEVKKYLEKNGVKSVILSQKKINQGLNITEESLRELRYSLITNYCKKYKIKNVLMAHHLDDNIETFLMRVERGSGLQGLSSIQNISEINGIKFIRPLLSYSKYELKEFLIQNKIKWFEDPSNASKKFTRNKLRSALLEISDYQTLSKRINLVIENISRANNFIELEVEKFLQENCKNILNNCYEIRQDIIRQTHTEIAFRAIKMILLKIYNSIRKNGEKIKKNEIRLEVIKNIYEKIVNEEKHTFTSNYCEIIIDNDFVYIFPELSKINSYKPLGIKNLDEIKKNHPQLKKYNYKILRTLDKNLF